MEFPPQLQTTQTRSTRKSFKLSSLLPLIALFALCSCEEDKDFKPRYNGGPGEVLVVMDKNTWHAPPGELVRDFLLAPLDGLPQEEAKFIFLHFVAADMDTYKKKHRNIVIADIGDNERNIKTRTVIEESKWSNEQVVYTIHAKDDSTFMAEFERIGSALVQDILDRDRDRLVAYQRVIRKPSLTVAMNDTMGVDLVVPIDFVSMKVSETACTFLRSRMMAVSGVSHDLAQGLTVYTYPYTGPEVFTPEYQSAMRDSLVGPLVLSRLDYPMIVEPRVPVTTRELDHNGDYAYQVRGLWRFDDPVSGGPFISLSKVDEKNARVITVDGYVFGPKFEKRDYVRELEAILQTVEF